MAEQQSLTVYNETVVNAAIDIDKLHTLRPRVERSRKDTDTVITRMLTNLLNGANGCGKDERTESKGFKGGTLQRAGEGRSSWNPWIRRYDYHWTLNIRDWRHSKIGWRAQSTWSENPQTREEECRDLVSKLHGFNWQLF